MHCGTFYWLFVEVTGPAVASCLLFLRFCLGAHGVRGQLRLCSPRVLDRFSHCAGRVRASRASRPAELDALEKKRKTVFRCPRAFVKLVTRFEPTYCSSSRESRLVGSSEAVRRSRELPGMTGSNLRRRRGWGAHRRRVAFSRRGWDGGPVGAHP